MRKRRMVTGTLTITDEEQKTANNKPRPEFSSTGSQQYCVQKERIELVIAVVVLLILLQIALAIFLYRKCLSMRFSSRTSSVYSDQTSTSLGSSTATSSTYSTCNRRGEEERRQRHVPFTENPYDRVLYHFH
uniref:Uncharacterized protein n=1 Tax=Caenorhabditis japonica TaxID=281687 RepID=A0A8R1E6B0_CAEJA